MTDSKIFYVLLIMLSGAVMPIQSALNLYLAKWSGSFTFASMISFFVGTVCLIVVVLLFSKVSFSSLDFSQTPPFYAWLGGFLGAFFVTMVIISAPKIGMTSMFLSIISGQLLMSIIIDKYGFFGFDIKEVSITKIVAVIFVITGTWLYTLDK
ncbi:hypothetical protein CPU12_09010 [Malaciobacter molluscorum LMG 25693]|uniref:Inner membrane exporter, YdcZ family n=1 Tax=Malaciobacter molluscorum LMG 25693 TaxID=870501 RepID=A0A2G1DGW9_9BACT|nr:DMT family transporter [Malaciobacter molluscorum]AXX92291.1 putative inner membrane exporter, YdcZ family [Malaciobacter molluscorum LMG 25693]PHO17723.1 hypothetical protein CPU12_09010 [Malaciobacter molluscorum LMG 25693]